MLEGKLINEIERRYAQYCVSDSDTMLFFSTREFINYLKSYRVIDQIFNRLCKDYPFSDEELSAYMTTEYFTYFKEITESREKYAAFSFQFLNWGFEQKKFNILHLHSEARWTCSNDREYSKKDQIKLFKTDVVYNIVSYVVDELRKGSEFCHILMRFGERAMRFRTLSDINDENNLQDRIGLYLYDNGYSFSREENSGNGKADFLVSDDDDYVVEVKYVGDGNNCTTSDLKRWSSQLDDYMRKYSSRHGILYVVSRKDYVFLWDGKCEDKDIMNVYIGKLKPSERNTKKIVLRIE